MNEQKRRAGTKFRRAGGLSLAQPENESGRVRKVCRGENKRRRRRRNKGAAVQGNLIAKTLVFALSPRNPSSYVGRAYRFSWESSFLVPPPPPLFNRLLNEN